MKTSTPLGSAFPLPPSVGDIGRSLTQLCLQPPLTIMMRQMASHHPAIFERMTNYAAAVFVVDPTDLPVRFAMVLERRSPSLRVATDDDIEAATATIQGPIALLVDLLEGKIDGDALFFSRQLVVEGDTEAIVALRNAVDGEEIDVRSEIARSTGPFAGAMRNLIAVLESVFARGRSRLRTLQDAILEPAANDIRSQRHDIDALRDQIAELKRGGRKPRSGFSA